MMKAVVPEWTRQIEMAFAEISVARRHMSDAIIYGHPLAYLREARGFLRNAEDQIHRAIFYAEIDAAMKSPPDLRSKDQYVPSEEGT